MFRVLIGLLAAVAACNAKVGVTVYYESLCLDSQAFITQQLYPAAKNYLKDYVDIVWVPYGKATTQSRGTEFLFQCQHGEDECYGNKVQACAIEHIEANSYRTDQTKESLTLDYINCLMKVGKNFPDQIYPGKSCAKEAQIENSWRTIADCANGTEGSLLLKKFGEMTPPLTNVPTVAINQKIEPELSQRATSSFVQTVCSFISMPKPAICTQNDAPQSIMLAPIAAIASIVAYRML